MRAARIPGCGAGLVLPTATDDAAASHFAGQGLCRAGLGVLATDHPLQAGYAGGVRAEYAHVPDDAFARGRTAVLEQLLGHDRLATTAAAHELWERPARVNREAELRALRPP